MSVLDMVSSAPPSRKKQGKGKGKEADPEAKWKEVMMRMVPVVANLERRTGQLEDRSSFVAIIKDEEMKETLLQVREKYKELAPEKKKADVEDVAEEKAPEPLPPHPMGGPQRAVIFKALPEMVVKKLPSDHPDKAFLKACL